MTGLTVLRHGRLVDYQVIPNTTRGIDVPEEFILLTFEDAGGKRDSVLGNRDTTSKLLMMVSGGAPAGFHFCYTVDGHGFLVTLDPAERTPCPFDEGEDR